MKVLIASHTFVRNTAVYRKYTICALRGIKRKTERRKEFTVQLKEYNANAKI